MRISDWSSDVCSSDLHPLVKKPSPAGVETAAIRIDEPGEFAGYVALEEPVQHAQVDAFVLECHAQMTDRIGRYPVAGRTRQQDPVHAPASPPKSEERRLGQEWLRRG